jgi:hypothetical protein
MTARLDDRQTGAFGNRANRPRHRPQGCEVARVEARGVASVIESIAAANKDDGRRRQGAAVMDDLYELFRRKR